MASTRPDPKAHLVVVPRTPPTDVGEAAALSDLLFRTGKMLDVCALAEARSNRDSAESVPVAVSHGMALFELGAVCEAVVVLEDATANARTVSPSLECRSMLALFSRASQFQSADEMLPMLSRLRQLVSMVADTSSIGSLHLVVARLEASRGHCAKARRHLEMARQLIQRTDSAAAKASVELVDSALEMYAGNLTRATASARRGLECAAGLDMRVTQAGCASNLGFLALCSGSADRARELLQSALDAAAEMSFVKLSVLDTLAQLAIYSGHVTEAEQRLSQCADVIGAQTVPARSWYDLAHQVTRCAYFEQLEDWPRIVAIADEADEELARRQFRAIRTSLLCAKARALAHLEQHAAAEAALSAAVRACPRGAVDPLIAIEASRGLCLGLRADYTSASAHFDRAVAGCRAIGHRYHERWIERDRRSVAARQPSIAPARETNSVTDTALLLSDVSAVLSAGQALDILTQRTAAILQSAGLAERVHVRSESGWEYQPEPAANCSPTPDGGFAIRLRGSDRAITIVVSDVRSLEEISLMKSLTDVVQVAVSRARDAEHEDEHLALWPRALPAGREDVVFRSPRMLELLRVAVRLAAADLPILLTGETGTGKEVFARLIHEHSQVAQGPFVGFNCSAMPRELVESQLFGHRRGAFTGAMDSFPGVIRAAERGTLFLDEVADVDITIQPKFLRFLESHEIQSIGELKPQRVKVRIVAATNADLDALVAQGRFRSDLFYRLGVARLALPPLRERKDEIPALAALFLDRYAGECKRTGVRLGDDAVAALLLYSWPGNIRQLANEMRRVAAMASDGET